MERQFYKKIVTLGSLSLSIFGGLRGGEEPAPTSTEQKFQLSDHKMLIGGVLVGAAALYMLYRWHTSAKDTTQSSPTQPAENKKSRLEESSIERLKNAQALLRSLHDKPDQFGHNHYHASEPIRLVIGKLTLSNNIASRSVEEQQVIPFYHKLQQTTKDLETELYNISRCLPGTQNEAIKDLQRRIKETTSTIISEYQTIIDDQQK